MLFNSLAFLAFLPIVLAVYWLLNRHYRLQNAFLLLASWFFYGWWDWRFLGLLVLTSAVDHSLGVLIHRTEDARRRKLFLVLSLVQSLGILGFFKYYGFFVESFAALLDSMGWQAHLPVLKVVLPVGISFYTFQSISYIVDIYRRRIAPAGSFLDFAAYVAFFPQLVAGPIERAIDLMPQFQRPRTFKWADLDGAVFLIVWGFFKKVVIADNVAAVANAVFDQHGSHAGVDTVLGVLAFAIQIYCDFSAYSDIARGVARLFGFELMVNFRNPYFAINPSDFWRRWHISLSQWLRDYLYVPLGGNRHGTFRTYRNLALTMLLGGLWHGAAWTFVAWGAFHGLILILYRIFDRFPDTDQPWAIRYAIVRIPPRMALMFCLTLVGWLFFRATSIGQAFAMLGNVGLATTAKTADFASTLAFYGAPLVVMETWQYLAGDALAPARRSAWALGAAYGLVAAGILVFGVREATEFIYFQF